MIYELSGTYKDSNGYHDSIKIGYSFEPFEVSRRFAYDTHNYGYQFLGETIGDREDESNLQWLFREDLLRGEWFKDSLEIRYIFKRYQRKDWPIIKSFFSLSRDIPVVNVWAQVLHISKEEWLDFLWKLSMVLYNNFKLSGWKRLYDYVDWVGGPGSNNHLPTRDILRKSLLEINDNISKSLLDFLPESRLPEIDLFSSQFLFDLRSEYCLPCYPGLFRKCCEFLDENQDRDDVRNVFYDPRPKMLYEKFGTSGCKEENFNLEKLYEKVCSDV